MAFHASYTVPATQQAIAEALARRGLRRSLPRDKRCLVQWAPFSRTAWNQALDGRMLVGNILVHAGVGSKHELFRLLARAAAAGDSDVARVLLRTHCINGGVCGRHGGGDKGDSAEPASDGQMAPAQPARVGLQQLEALVRRIFTAESPHGTVAGDSGGGGGGSSGSSSSSCCCWVIKGSTANNALEVFVVSSLAAALAAVNALAGLAGKGAAGFQATSEPLCGAQQVLGTAAAASVADTIGGTADTSATTTTRTTTTAWVVQEYVARPLLLRGTHKFHLRCNVLVVGNAEIFVHRDYVCHAATEPYRMGDFGNRWVHITNHGEQRSHPDFRSDLQTLPRQEFLAAMRPQLAAAGVSADAWGAALWAALRSAARAVLLACARDRRLFLPMPNMFEVFGFDFLLAAPPSASLADTAAAPSSAAGSAAGEKPAGGGCPAIAAVGGALGGLPAIDKADAPAAAVSLPPRPPAVHLKLLEVNSGPALEGTCCPVVCRRVVEDTVRIVLDRLRPAPPPRHLGPFGADCVGGAGVDSEDDDTDTDDDGRSSSDGDHEGGETQGEDSGAQATSYECVWAGDLGAWAKSTAAADHAAQDRPTGGAGGASPAGSGEEDERGGEGNGRVTAGLGIPVPVDHNLRACIEKHFHASCRKRERRRMRRERKQVQQQHLLLQPQPQPQQQQQPPRSRQQQRQQRHGADGHPAGDAGAVAPAAVARPAP